MAATIKVPTVFVAHDKLTSVVKTMTRSVNKFSRTTSAGIVRMDQKITGSFKRLGRLSQIGLGIGLAGLFSMAVQGNLEYNESLASLSAITGSTGKDLGILEQNVLKLGKKTGKSGAEIAKAFELVGSAKPELLKNVDALSQTTDSVITLSKASKLDLETSARSLTGVMNQFNLGAEHSNRTINTLAAGAKEGAAAIPQISEAILQFGTGAAASNVSLEQSVALVETFAEKGIQGAEAGTKLRNILTKMSATGALPKEAITQLEKFGVNTKIVSNAALPLNVRLKELSKIAGDSTALVKVFGLENKEAGQILLNNIPTYERLTNAVEGTTEAERQAAINSNTLVALIDKVKASFSNATTAVNTNSQSLEFVKDILRLVANNMETVVGVAIWIIGAFTALKVVSGTIQFIESATKLWAGAQWLLNAAMTANPIGIVITAIGLLIGLVTVIITKYDSWGASLALLLGPLGFIINLIMSFKRHWESIVSTFKEGGIVAGIKRIGFVLADALLMPVQQFLGLLAKIPGVSKLIKPVMEKVRNVRQNLDNATGVYSTEGTIGKPLNDGAKAPFLMNTQQQTSKQIIEKSVTGNLNIDINDPGKHIKAISQTGSQDIPLRFSTTQGQR
ncbi:phage tail tape measure protein [Leeuwenhoekiella blandensis]|uniref:phage tail tape measure protein n=1 Tax=Leeuwenhoekiella blandensis TaxID=360293 RepID=UPI0023573BA4|nr:phage tail tape measure protein [Leeuwenhoekiella blandensis]